MNKNELEELRDKVAHHLLSKMSQGSQFMYALERMYQLCEHYSEEELLEMLPKEKSKKKKFRSGGF
tara:strand:+ start:391 stop:588 length:198 start_codon:yes stop_codon:yes gene_type:complete